MSAGAKTPSHIISLMSCSMSNPTSITTSMTILEKTVMSLENQTRSTLVPPPTNG